MADPVGFEGSNVLLRGYGEIRDMSIYHEPGVQFISCWRLTKEELARVNETGVVWLSVLQVGPYGPPPVLVSGKALVMYGQREARAEPVLPSVPHGDRDVY